MKSSIDSIPVYFLVSACDWQIINQMRVLLAYYVSGVDGVFIGVDAVIG